METKTDLQQVAKSVLGIKESPTQRALASLSSVEWKSVEKLVQESHVLPAAYEALRDLGIADEKIIGGIACYRRNEIAPYKP